MKKVIFAIIMSLISPVVSYGHYYDLEITNIKPSGTDPKSRANIPSTNRIFHAYPGIEYNIRPAVIGGMYPYKFSLSNQPSGMTIDENTGEISWPNPQSSSGTITVHVEDSDSPTINQTSASWAITVGTSGFVFVDDIGGTGGAGTIGDPFKSLNDLLSNTSVSDGIAIFRGGTYTWYVTSEGRLNTNGEIMTWLAYPGETVIMDGNDLELRNSYESPYIDGIDFHNFIPHGFNIQGALHYQTFRRCTFTDLTPTDAQNENNGFLYFNSGDTGYYLVIQDNEFSDYDASGSYVVQAIGSIYEANYLLIEDNYIHSEGSGLTISIVPKNNVNRMTIRHNIVIKDSSSGDILGNGINSYWDETTGVEICFNYFKKVGSTHRAMSVANRSYTYNIKDEYVYRNTLVGCLAIQNMDGADCDKFGDTEIVNNVIVSEEGTTVDGQEFTIHEHLNYRNTGTANNPWNCVVNSGNLFVKAADNAIDSNGYLQGDYTSYIGIVGWETTAVSDTTPPEVSTTTIGSDGETVTITFSESVVATGYDTGDFDLDCNGQGGINNGLIYSSGSGTSTLIFSTTSKIYLGESCDLDYTGGNDEIEDLAYNDLETFSDASVTNNSTATIQRSVSGGAYQGSIGAVQ